jgi:hypothetical protein
MKVVWEHMTRNGMCLVSEYLPSKSCYKKKNNNLVQKPGRHHPHQVINKNWGQQVHPDGMTEKVQCCGTAQNTEPLYHGNFR